MPVWLISVLANLPAIIAAINEIVAAIQAAGGTPTPAQLAQLAAYQGMVAGINDALGFHVGV